MDLHIGWVELLLRIGLSLLCGAVLGWEREGRRKAAGLRTYMMVCMGAAAFMITTIELAETAHASGVAADPVRLIGGLVGGIGFLGAGTIIRGRESVEGVTTAAGIWVMGAIGAACGVGQYQIAGVTTVAAFLVLTVVGRIDRRLRGQKDTDEE